MVKNLISKLPPNNQWNLHNNKNRKPWFQKFAKFLITVISIYSEYCQNLISKIPPNNPLNFHKTKNRKYWFQRGPNTKFFGSIFFKDQGAGSSLEYIGFPIGFQLPQWKTQLRTKKTNLRIGAYFSYLGEF